MQFSYTKFENYQQEVSRQKKYLKFYLGAIGYVIIFAMFNVMGTSRSLDDSPGSAVRGRGGNGPLENFVVWTYPDPPPKDELNPELNERLYCSFAPCAPQNEDINFYPEPYFLNLLELTSMNKYLKSFNIFVKKHYWYKLLHGANFPHHVQSVAIISLLSAYPNACVRSLGQDISESVCASDFKKYKSYDPTDVNSVPPFAVQFRDLPERYGILDYSSQFEEIKNANLENQMQSLSSLQFMPYLTDLVDINSGIPDFEGNLLMNGWYGGNIAFPPPERASVTMTSVHFESSMLPTLRDNIDFFRVYNAKVGPVGATDATTNAYLRDHGIETYHSSGFLSMMTVSRDEGRKKKKKNVVIVDYSVDLFPGLIPDEILDDATHVKTRVPSGGDSMAQFRRSYEVLNTIATADVVICFNVETAFLATANSVVTILVGNIYEMESTAHGNAHLFHR
jgi:hypothetical protein